MIVHAAAILLLATLSSAQALDDAPIKPSAVRQALVDTLGPRAAALGAAPSLRDYIGKMEPKVQADARTRLDALDRSALTAAALTDLSRAYILLGAHQPAAEAGLALHGRDPSKTQGLVLAAFAKLDQGDYPGCVALAEQALKINPRDLDAMSVFQAAKGRAAPAAVATTLTQSAENGSRNSTPVVDTRPLKPSARFEPSTVPPEFTNDSPAPPARNRAPWLPYAVGGTLTLIGIGLSIKHAREQAGEIAEQTEEQALDGATNLYFKGKDFVQEHPKTAIATGLGAVALGGWLVLPVAGIGGSGLMFATANGATSSVAVAGASAGAAKISALGAVATIPMLMAGDGDKKNVKEPSSEQSSAAPETRVRVKEKPAASDSELQRAIDKLFQPGDTVSGGTAGAAEKEFFTKQPTSTKFHLQASKDRLIWLERIAKHRPLSAQDRLTAEMLMNDLRNAIRLYTPTP